jgi:transcriptional regulator with XRE-family HTH domain
LYKKIKELCRNKGISIYHLEKVLKLSTGSICKWDKSVPRADTLQKVAEYLGVPISYLLDEDKQHD